MAQIVFMLFEDKQEPEDSEERYKVEIHFTPGAKGREEIIASEESVHSAENAKVDISKTLLYTSLKRLIPESKRRQFSPINYSPSTRLGSTLSNVQGPCDLDELVPQRHSKSKSLPSIFYVPPSTNDTNDQDSVISTHPVDITAQPIPELAPLQLNDSPINKEPHCKQICSVICKTHPHHRYNSIYWDWKWEVAHVIILYRNYTMGGKFL